MKPVNGTTTNRAAAVLLSAVLLFVLAGCAQGEADEASGDQAATSEPATASEPAPEPGAESEPAAGEGTDPALDEVFPEDPEVTALCDQFFDEVVTKAETGDLNGMFDAIDTWAKDAKGTPIAKETRKLARLFRGVATGDVSPDGEKLTKASADFGVKCATHGWTPPAGS